MIIVAHKGSGKSFFSPIIWSGNNGRPNIQNEKSENAVVKIIIKIFTANLNCGNTTSDITSLSQKFALNNIKPKLSADVYYL